MKASIIFGNRDLGEDSGSWKIINVDTAELGRDITVGTYRVDLPPGKYKIVSEHNTFITYKFI